MKTPVMNESRLSEPDGFSLGNFTSKIGDEVRVYMKDSPPAIGIVRDGKCTGGVWYELTYDVELDSGEHITARDLDVEKI